ncbi:MAG: SDR family oxidoreductase [Rhodospirillales bacterium]
MPHLFIFGLGYSAGAVARRALAAGWQVTGTTRDAAKAKDLEGDGLNVLLLSPVDERTALSAALADSTHLLSSAAPGEAGDPILEAYRDTLLDNAESLRWIGYLSSLSVYGDRQGAWVEETTRAEPSSAVGRRRLEAEQAWGEFAKSLALPLAVFRIAGIYGPGRNLLRDLKAGKARQVTKPGQVFNRIHVADIAGAVLAAMERPERSGVFNLADREPAAQSQVVQEAARLLGVAAPPATPVAEANLSPMAQRFWSENRRVSAHRLTKDLDYALRYPTYREGLAGLLSSER